MKIASSQVDKFFSNIPLNIKSILLYGSDNGLVFERAKRLEKYFESQKSGLIVNRVSFAKIKNNEFILEEIVSNLNFFTSFTLIIIEDFPTTIPKNIEVAINMLAHEFFIILLASELPIKSSTRKFFESGKNLAAIACYPDQEFSVIKLVKNTFRQHQIKAEENTIRYIAQNLYGDRRIIVNELQKIITYLGNGHTLSLADAKRSLSLFVDYSLEEFCYILTQKKYANALSSYTKLIEQGVPVITIIRVLTNHFIRIFQVKQQVNIKGKAINMAMQELIPPVFIMNIEKFQASVNNFALNELDKILKLLHDLEVSSKTFGIAIDNFFQYFLYIIESKNYSTSYLNKIDC